MIKKNKTFIINYRDEFSATIKAKSRNEAIKKFNNSDCEIECIGDLWEEYMEIEEEGVDFSVCEAKND